MCMSVARSCILCDGLYIERQFIVVGGVWILLLT